MLWLVSTSAYLYRADNSAVDANDSTHIFGFHIECQAVLMGGQEAETANALAFFGEHELLFPWLRTYSDFVDNTHSVFSGGGGCQWSPSKGMKRLTSYSFHKPTDSNFYEPLSFAHESSHDTILGLGPLQSLVIVGVVLQRHDELDQVGSRRQEQSATTNEARVKTETQGLDLTDNFRYLSRLFVLLKG